MLLSGMDRERKAIVLLETPWEKIVLGGQPEVWGPVGMAALNCALEVTAVPPA